MLIFFSSCKICVVVAMYIVKKNVMIQSKCFTDPHTKSSFISYILVHFYFSQRNVD